MSMADSLHDSEKKKLYYDPLPSQKIFHYSTARFKGFSGPVGSGKSKALAHEAIKLAIVNAGRLGVIGAPTYPMLRDVTQRALFESLDQARIGYQVNRAENALTLLENGSRIIFRPLENFERLRGTNLAWFGVDELSYCPEEAWTRLEARLRDPMASRLCGYAVWTPKGHDWVYRRFVEKQVEGYCVVFAKAYENRHVLDKIPDFYERLRSSYDEKLFQQEVLGEYLSLGGDRVYHAFERNVNVVDDRMESHGEVLLATDFNVDPMCAIVARRYGDELYVTDEIVLRNGTTEQMCDEFHTRYRSGAPGVVIYGDASGSRRQTSGYNDYQIIRDSFRGKGYSAVTLKVPKANPPVRERVAKVNARLKSADGEHRLFISGKCRGLIKDLEEVSYKDGTAVVDKDAHKERTHLSDALGYLVWQEYGPLMSAGEMGNPLF